MPPDDLVPLRPFTVEEQSALDQVLNAIRATGVIVWRATERGIVPDTDADYLRSLGIAPLEE